MSKLETMVHRQNHDSSGNHGSPQVEPYSAEIMAAAAKLTAPVDDAVTEQQVMLEKPIAEMTHDECLAHMLAQAKAEEGHTRKLPEPETQLWPIMQSKVCEKTKARWKEAGFEEPPWRRTLTIMDGPHETVEGLERQAEELQKELAEVLLVCY